MQLFTTTTANLSQSSRCLNEVDERGSYRLKSHHEMFKDIKVMSLLTDADLCVTILIL